MDDGEANGRNVVLTGLPRSGTTLACYLLNKLPDTVALSEAFTPRRAVKLRGREAVCDRLGRFFDKMRRMILDEGAALSKQIGGEVPDNPFGRARDEAGSRKQLASKGRIEITKPLTPDFLLVIKQPGLFTALLPGLADRFPVHAVVRNPLSVLASWNSLESGTQNVGFPLAEGYDEDFARRLGEEKDDVGRQLCVMSWFFESYERSLPRCSIVRYEDIVTSGGGALSVVTPPAENLEETLKSKNLNPLYDRGRMLDLGARLLESEGAYWRFYSRDSVEELLEGLVRGTQ